jgi:protein subunit release factor B
MAKESKKKELLFAVTRDDCEWTYYIGPGDGGQKKQKTHSAARCVHKESRAEGKCHDSRSQWENRKTAFKRMTETDKFKLWVKLEVSRRTRDKNYEQQEQERLERYINNTMKPENILTQILKDGQWVTVEAEQLSEEEI